MPLRTVPSKRIDATRLITHRFALARILEACDTFSMAAQTQALKVIVEA